MKKSNNRIIKIEVIMDGKSNGSFYNNMINSLDFHFAQKVEKEYRIKSEKVKDKNNDQNDELIGLPLKIDFYCGGGSCIIVNGKDNKILRIIRDTKEIEVMTKYDPVLNNKLVKAMSSKVKLYKTDNFVENVMLLILDIVEYSKDDLIENQEKLKIASFYSEKYMPYFIEIMDEAMENLKFLKKKEFVLKMVSNIECNKAAEEIFLRYCQNFSFNRAQYVELMMKFYCNEKIFQAMMKLPKFDQILNLFWENSTNNNRLLENAPYNGEFLASMFCGEMSRKEKKYMAEKCLSFEHHSETFKKIKVLQEDL